MSNHAINWAKPLKIPRSEKVVLLLLAEHADCTLECFPSIRLLASEASLSDRSVQRAVGWLLKAGLILAERGGGRSNATRYTVLMGAMPPPVQPPAAPIPAAERVTLTPERVTTTTERVTTCPIKGDNHDIAYIDEPPIEPPIEPPVTPTAREARQPGLALVLPKPVPIDIEAEFARWWSEYPGKRGGKADARRKYAQALKQPTVTPALLLHALRAYPFDRREFPRFIPHGSRWLNAGFYENALEATPLPPSEPKRSAASDARLSHFARDPGPDDSFTIDGTCFEEHAR